MLFNSIEFAIFLPIVFILYWYATNGNLKLQNSLLVIASYIFYGWWDWRFLFLIAFSSAVDYFVGLQLAKTDNQRNRKLLLSISILINLGFLGFFKYFNFFTESFTDAFTLLGKHIEPTRLNIILPVGISFYTFQTLSYTIDVYTRKLKPTKDIIAFSAFVSFFPQLVAGPIERATNLLPQFYSKRIFDYSKAVDGMRQILWGLFKKVVIADNCAEYANIIFNNSTEQGGSTLVLGAIFFAFQIYGDFSGYSDIAIGTSRLFGFNLMKNFAYPYFSRDIAEFWRRWHISLSTWFRDYLYIPLGGSKGSTLIQVRNTFLIFIVSGFWHGANWTFIVWGALNAIYFLPLLLTKNNRKNLDTAAKENHLPSIKEGFSMLLTFGLTTFAWIFFRAENISHAIQYIKSMLGGLQYKWGYIQTIDFLTKEVENTFPIILALFFLMEWFGRKDEFAIKGINVKWEKTYRWFLYYTLIVIIILFSGKEQEFIYFQF